MTDLTQYISINHHLMTTAEMAEELGVDVLKIRTILSANKWKAISEADRVREYIEANKDAYLEDVCEKFGKQPQTIRGLAKEVGVRLVNRPERKPEPVKTKLSFTSHLFPSRYDEKSWLRSWDDGK